MKTPPVTHGSAAVRIGGPALTYLLAQAARNGCTARVAAETIILQHEHAPDGERSLGAAVLEQVAAGADPVQAACAVVVAAVAKKVRKPRAVPAGELPVSQAVAIGKPKKGARK